MAKHLIRFATIADVDSIMNFIDMHWKKNHILATNKDFFLYEYAYNNDVNFAIAIDEATNELVGLCGFIKNSFQLKGSTIWGSLWKVIKTENPMLGINILEFVNNNSGCVTFSSCGIALKTIPIYDFLRFKTGKLEHYYRLKDKIDYKIAVVNEKIILEPKAENQYKLQLFERFNDLESVFKRAENSINFSSKDNWYLQKRYFNHPIYNYKVFAIVKEEINSILVTREIIQNGVKILRIVDFVGLVDDLNYIGTSINDLIVVHDYEYIDFYCHGIPVEIMKNSGFKLRDESDTTIIPNYFEPFVQENIPIYFFTTSNDTAYVFKADGDQDRPSFN